MKKWIVMLFAMHWLFSAAADSGRTVIVGYYSEPGMMNGAEAGAVKSGYAYEYLQEIASRAGWRYQYVYGRFDELYPKLESGEIDLLPYVNYSDERAKVILYPSREMGSERFYLAAKTRGTLDGDLAQLAGKKVGTSRASFDRTPFVDLMKERQLPYELVEYDTVSERWDALMKGEIDFSIETSSMRQSDDVYAVYELPGEHPYHLAVAPGRSDLLAELDRAQEQLAQDDPGYLHALKFRHFRGVPIFKMLTPAAEKWLQGHEAIRIGSYDGQMPFVYSDKDGEIVGMAPDCVRKMFGELGVKTPVEWVLFDGRESAVKALKSGQIDLIYPYYNNHSDAESEGVFISARVFGAPFGVLYRGDYTADTLSVIATPMTRLGYQYVRDEYPKSERIGCRDGHECVERLLAGEATCVVMYLPILQQIAAELDEELNVKGLSSQCGICFAALPSNADLIGLVNKAIPYLDKVTMNDIENRHAIASSVNISGWQFFRKNPVYLYGAAIVLLTMLVVVMLLRRRTVVRYMRETEKALQVARAADQAKTEFLFNMSHDVRTPMNAIKGFTEIAEKNVGDPEKVLDCLGKIKKSGGLLLSLINSVLDMSRVESGKARLEETPGDVRLPFTSIETTMQELAKEKGVELIFEFGEIANRYVYADYDRSSRVFVNLISNAIKYSKPNGWVRVRCEQVGGKVEGAGGRAWYRYTFADNGIGMSEEFQKHLFEQFAREQNSTTSGILGTGLGLTLCKSFVGLMGGTITCKSKQGEGTTFTVDLPFRVQEEQKFIDPDTGSTVSADGEREVEEPMKFPGKRVLLVEDNELNREVALYVLKEQGFDVEAAEDGSIAVRMVREKGFDYYDYILMDIQMPVMGGYEATKIIRGDGFKRPIIALSANAFAEDRAASLSAGMDDHVAKPIKVKELLTVLSKCGCRGRA